MIYIEDFLYVLSCFIKNHDVIKNISHMTIFYISRKLLLLGCFSAGYNFISSILKILKEGIIVIFSLNDLVLKKPSLNIGLSKIKSKKFSHNRL